MANIILTFIDSKNGVVNVSYDFKDEDIEKIYTTYQHYLSPPRPSDPDYEPEPHSPKDIVASIYDNLMNGVTALAYQEEIKMACESLNIKRIQATGTS